MDSKATKAKGPAPTKTKPVIISRAPQDATAIIPQDTIPIIPHDIIIEILDYLASDSDFQSLRACALVSKPWVQPCQRHLFHTAHFTPANACTWLETFPVQEKSPAHHVKDLRLEIGKPARIVEGFFECIPWFTNVDKLSFLGRGGVPLGFGGFSPLWEPSCWKLPRSVTSLTINTGAVTLVQVRDIMAQLPNLDDLALLVYADAESKKSPGIGAVLKGRFSGRLRLAGECIGEDVINMLLEIPSGLRFAELGLEFGFSRTCLLPSAIRLAEACRKTLVKLSHTADIHCESYPSPSPVGSTLTPFPVAISYNTRIERSFDFSKFPNIQEVTFDFRAHWKDWRDRGLPWIPAILSTLEPATSPRLSVIRLYVCSFPADQDVEIVTGGRMANDLRRISEEIARIKREFKRPVNFTVLRNSKLGVVLDSVCLVEETSRLC